MTSNYFVYCLTNSATKRRANSIGSFAPGLNEQRAVSFCALPDRLYLVMESHCAPSLNGVVSRTYGRIW